MLSQLSKLGFISEPALYSNSFFLILNTFIGSLFGYVFWWMIARQVGTLELGIASGLFASIAIVATLADMGFGVALIRYFHSLGKQQNGFINSCILAVSFFSLLFSLVFIVFFWLGGSAAEISVALVFILSCVFFSLAQFLDRIFVAFEATALLFIRNLLLNVTRVIVLLFLVKTYGVLGVIISIGIGSVVSLGFSLWRFIPKVFVNFKLFGDFSWHLVRRYTTFSLGNHIAQLSWSIPVYLFPVLVLGVFGPLINGQFYLTWMVANFIYVIPSAISTVAFARFANQESFDQLGFRRILGFTLFLLVPTMLVMVVGSPWILGFFGHDYYSNGKTLLVWLLLTSFPYTVNIFAIVRFRMQERVRAVILLSGIIIISSLVLLPLLGMLVGMTGLGIGWFLAQLVGCSWLVVSDFLIRKFPLFKHHYAALITRGN